MASTPQVLKRAVLKHYPWVSSPVIASAPMGGFAGGPIAAAVSSAGGIGFIGALNNMEVISGQLEDAKSLLSNKTFQSLSSSNNNNGVLPIGIGFLIFLVKLQEVKSLMARYRPAAIWLSCPVKNEHFKAWVEGMREASPQSKIWIQLSSVKVAVEIVKTCQPDVLVMQGIDAGGHGLCPGAGVISLVPETIHALEAEGLLQDVAVMASGGISDSKSVAAALALGAEGVLVGTRFLASKEIDLPSKEFRDVLIAANDGGYATARGTIFDELNGPTLWPAGYDGRAIVGGSYLDFANQVSIDEIRKKYAEAIKENHKGFGGDVRGAVWAGTGVGFVKKVETAGDIVRELQAGAKQALEMAIGKL